MANQFGGFLTALGSAFGGLAHDEDEMTKRQQYAAQMARQATLDAQNSETHRAQMANYASEGAVRASKLASNERAYNTLKQVAPTHVLVAQPYDVNTDYAGELTKATEGQAKQRQHVLDQRAHYNTLHAEFPKHVLSVSQFDEANPADYGAALTDARAQRGIESQRLAAEAVANKPQRVQVDDGRGGVKWAWLRPGEEAPVGKLGAGGPQERAGQAAAFLSRLKMGKADFDNGMQFVRNYHDKLMKGEQTITPGMMAEQSAATTSPNPDAHGMMGMMNNAGGALAQGFANKQLGLHHDDYQRYINLLNSMSLAMVEVLPRPTAQLLGIERGINTAKAGDTPERIQDIQHRLDKAYEYLFANPEAMMQKGGGAPRGAVPGGTGAAVPSFEDWLHSKGH